MSTGLGDSPTAAEQALLAYCESHREWVIETTLALARLESPTSDKAAVDRCGRELQQRLEAIGGTVTRLAQAEAGDHLRAEFGSGESQVLMLGHFDTVWPVGQIARMPLEFRNGCLFGPGVFDMKAGIAVGLLAARALQEASPSAGRLVMLWTSDEERGSRTSRAVIEEEARRSRAALVLEPGLPGGGLKTARKGCGEFRLAVHGVAAHAGVEPDKGASAVHELAAQIVDLQRVRSLGPDISLNVGMAAGGTLPNVVAEEAHAVIDTRVSVVSDMDRVIDFVRNRTPTVPGTRIEVTGGFDRPPLERTASVARLYERARAIAGRLGHDLREGATGGGSDGNFTAAVGTPTLDGLGAVGAGPHALHEHIEVDSLPWRSALLAALVADVGALA
jgi:glutamate carboxypeptidase